MISVAGSSSPPAANPQVERMIGVLDPYTVASSIPLPILSGCRRSGMRSLDTRARQERLDRRAATPPPAIPEQLNAETGLWAAVRRPSGDRGVLLTHRPLHLGPIAGAIRITGASRRPQSPESLYGLACWLAWMILSLTTAGTVLSCSKSQVSIVATVGTADVPDVCLRSREVLGAVLLGVRSSRVRVAPPSIAQQPVPGIGSEVGLAPFMHDVLGNSPSPLSGAR